MNINKETMKKVLDLTKCNSTEEICDVLEKEIDNKQKANKAVKEASESLIEEYKKLSSFADFAGQIADFEMAGKPNEFPFGVAPDFMNAQLNVLWADAPGTILPDTTYYAEDNEKGKELLATWRQMQEELLAKFDFSVKIK